MSVVARRQSKSDSETSSTEDHIGNSSQGSLDWCSSVGPLNWAHQGGDTGLACSQILCVDPTQQNQEEV